MAALRSLRVTAPDGLEWQIGRRWLTRGVRRSWSWRRDTGGDIASWNVFSGVGDVDPEGALLVIAGLAVFALIVVPLLLFGVELIFVGCVLAASLFGRIVLGRPWLVEARTVSGPPPVRVLEWKIVGWQRSRTHIQQVASELAAGRDPGALQQSCLVA